MTSLVGSIVFLTLAMMLAPTILRSRTAMVSVAVPVVATMVASAVAIAMVIVVVIQTQPEVRSTMVERIVVVVTEIRVVVKTIVV